jgi:hypothetical protein
MVVEALAYPPVDDKGLIGGGLLQGRLGLQISQLSPR